MSPFCLSVCLSPQYISFSNFQLLGELSLESGDVSSEVCELVEHIWQEAVGELTEILAVSIENIKMEQVLFFNFK